MPTARIEPGILDVEERRLVHWANREALTWGAIWEVYIADGVLWHFFFLLSDRFVHRILWVSIQTRYSVRIEAYTRMCSVYTMIGLFQFRFFQWDLLQCLLRGSMIMWKNHEDERCLSPRPTGNSYHERRLGRYNTDNCHNFSHFYSTPFEPFEPKVVLFC